MATAIPFEQVFQTSAGVPVSGVKIYVYVPETTTPRTAYSDTGLSVPIANPFIGNAAGYAAFYLKSDTAYRIVAKSADDAITYYDQEHPAASAELFDATTAAIAALTFADGDFLRATGVDTFEVLTTAEVVPRQTLESFGCTGDGTTDDYTALVAALAAGVPLAGTPGATYRYVGRLSAPARFNLDLNGATLKPVYAAASGDTSGQRYAIYSTLGTFGAINTVSAQTAGTRTVTLSTTPSGIAVGDMIGFFATSLSDRWPITYRKVVGISTNTLELDEMIPFAFGGTITCRKIAFNPEFVLMNGTIDCTGLTDGTAEVDGVIRTLSYQRRVLKNLRVTNLDIDPTATDYIFYADYCLDCVVEDCTAENAIRNGSFDSVFRFRSYTAKGNRYSGDGFGFAPVNGDSFWIENNEISGQHLTSSGTSYSVRGIRPIGCLEGNIVGNRIKDVDSAIKLEDCANIFVSRNRISYADTGVNFSDQYPDARSGGHVITHNIIEEYTEYGIVLGTTATGAGLWKSCIVQGNRVGTTNASASEPILIRGGTFEASGNIIYDWPSGISPFQTVTADGQLSKGILGSLYAVAPTATGRLGVDIDATHTGIAIDYERVVCNAPAGKFADLPPRTDIAYGRLYSGTVDLNVTTDQAITIQIPDGFTRYRAVAALMTNLSAANAGTAAGGIYTDASKAGTQIVASSQAYTSLTAQNTTQAMTIAAAAGSVLTDTSLFFSLTTAAGVAASGNLIILGYYIP